MAIFKRDLHKLRAASDAGFGKELLQYSFDGPFGELELGGDLLMSQTPEGAVQNGTLAWGERFRHAGVTFLKVLDFVQ